MIAIEPPVRFLIFPLASEGPSTHGTEGTSAATVVRAAAETATAISDVPITKADVTTRGRCARGGEAIVTEARKGYGLLVIGLDRMTCTDGGFHDDLTELVAGFDGPLGPVEARGANLHDPIAGGLDILVPVSRTQKSHRALEVALVFARAGSVPLTLILAVPTNSVTRRRGLTARLRPVDDEVLRQAVVLAEHYQIETRTAVRHDVPVKVAILDQIRRQRHNLA